MGSTITAVEPGAFRTEFVGRSVNQSRTAIADYAHTAANPRKEHDSVHGTQKGDPAKAAQAVITAAESPEARHFSCSARTPSTRSAVLWTSRGLNSKPGRCSERQTGFDA